MNVLEYTIKPVGMIHSCYSEKFGIPRQPGLVKNARGAIELLPPCDREEMYRELDSFSHIWVQFVFHEAMSDGWRPTVRPPWLGGQKRVGVFASRTPHRPNYLGISVVRYLGMRKEKSKLYLDISELDLLNGTPVVDIKPYVPYSDKVDMASSGFVQSGDELITVVYTREAEDACKRYEKTSGRSLHALITELLQQDPRPASQRHKHREYGMQLWDMNIRWLAEESMFTVVSVAKRLSENGHSRTASWGDGK